MHDGAKNLLDRATIVERWDDFAYAEGPIAAVVIAKMSAAHRRRPALFAVREDVLTQPTGRLGHIQGISSPPHWGIHLRLNKGLNAGLRAKSPKSRA